MIEKIFFFYLWVALELAYGVMDGYLIQEYKARVGTSAPAPWRLSSSECIFWLEIIKTIPYSIFIVSGLVIFEISLASMILILLTLFFLNIIASAATALFYIRFKSLG